MKAREIIPGWPRGRSTTRSAVNSKYEYRHFLWPMYRSEESQIDLEADAIYHAEQARMLHEFFFEAYRAKPPALFGGVAQPAECVLHDDCLGNKGDLVDLCPDEEFWPNQRMVIRVGSHAELDASGFWHSLGDGEIVGTYDIKRHWGNPEVRAA